MKKHCRQKHYLLINPIDYAIQGAAITPDEVLVELMNIEMLAIEQFKNGTATTDSWQKITTLMNVAETMARAGIGPEVLNVCQRCQEILRDAKHRYVDTGVMAVTEKEVFWFRELYEYHHLQRKSVSRSTYEKFIDKTGNLIRSKDKKVETI